MMAISLRECSSLADLSNLRDQYLDSCPEGQELYLEMKVHDSRAFVIEAEDTKAGYFLIGLDGVLLEYFVIPAYIHNAGAWFCEILQRCRIQKALCKSFDHTLLACCLDHQVSVQVGGILCREWMDRPHRKMESSLAIRIARPEDVAHIIAINEEVFDHPDQIRDYVQNERVLLFEKEISIDRFWIVFPRDPWASRVRHRHAGGARVSQIRLRQHNYPLHGRLLSKARLASHLWL